MSEIGLLIYHVVITLIAIAAGAWLAVWGFRNAFASSPTRLTPMSRVYMMVMMIGWMALGFIVWLIK